MAHLNLRDRVIETTIAYVGAAPDSGAVNLAQVQVRAEKGRAGALEETSVDGCERVSLAFRPRGGAKLNDCELMVRLVSGVSGGPDSLQNVAGDADAFVLVLESDPAASERNRSAVEAIREVIARTPRRRRPVVVQVNQDGAAGGGPLDIVIDEGWPRLDAHVSKGEGVMETLQRAVDVVVESLRGREAEAAPPRAFGPPRVEGNPLLGALRQILVATVTDQMSALEERLVDRLDRQVAASSELLASCTARIDRVAAALSESGARSGGHEAAALRGDLDRAQATLTAEAHALRETMMARFDAIDEGLARVDVAVVELGLKTGALAERAATRGDVERIEGRVGADVKSHREAVSVLLASLESGVERTASRGDVERLEAKLASESTAQKELVAGEIKEARKALREEVLRATTTATQPLQRVLDALSVETRKLTSPSAEGDVASLIQKYGVKSDGVRAQIESLIGESRAVATRVDELTDRLREVDGQVEEVTVQVKQVDSQVGRRMADVRDALHASSEKSEARLQALETGLAALTEELRKRNKSWFS